MTSKNKPDFSLFKSRAEQEFLYIMKFIAGDKELVIGAELFREIDRITNADTLRRTGVKKILRLSDEIGMPNYIRIYFIRPCKESLELTIKLLNENPRSSFEKVHIICVPRVQFLVKHMVEREGLLDNVVLHSLPSWELIFLDDDLISMEIGYFFTNVFVAGDLSLLSSVASALLNIQSVLGNIPCVYTIGEKSQLVYEIMTTLKGTQTAHSTFNTVYKHIKGEQHAQQIGHLVIVDRSMDYATLFCSQMVYEGLIDECFNIDAGILKVSNAVLRIDPVEKDSLLILSNQTDVVFSVLRHVHLTGLFGCIKAYAEYLRVEMNKKKENIDSKNVGQIKSMVKEELRDFLEKERLLQRHLALSEFIMQVKRELNFKEQLRVERNILTRRAYQKTFDFIIQRLLRGLNWAKTLQLMCLMSVCYDGIPISDFESLRKQFLATHGHHYLPLLISLEKLGILKYQSSKGTFAAVSRKLNLFQNNPSSQNTAANATPQSSATASAELAASAKTLSSVFDGFYAPLLCRLIEYQLFNAPALEDLRGNLGDVFQSNDSVRSHRHHVLARALAGKEPNPADRAILVVFLGGCTYTEINALRLLANSRGYYSYFVTTNIFTYERFLESVSDNP